MASRFPISYPGDLRPSLPGEAALRRIGKQLSVASGGKLLCVGAGAGPLGAWAARDLGAEVVMVDVSEAALSPYAGQFETHRVERLSELDFPDASFQSIIVDAWAPMPLEALVSGYRRLLAPRGRLVATYPVRVGRIPSTPLVKFWEQKLGEPLVLPRDILQLLERAGYEPQIIETIEDSGLDDFYRRLDPLAAGEDEKLREEISLFRSQGGRTTVSFAVLVGRRKEPGEKPPPSRNE